MPTLIFTSGPIAGRRISLEGDLVVGRENADVTIDDAELSRRHVRISGAEGAVTVEDLGSLNGTFVDDRRIENAVELRGGEIVRAGHSTFTLEPDPVPEPEPEPIADPNATRISDIPSAAAAPIADPRLTVTGDVPVAVPDATVTRPIPQEAEVERAVVGDRPPPESAAAPPPPPPSPPPPPPPPPPAPAPPRQPAPVAAAASASVEAPGEPFGALAQGGRRRGGVALAARGGVATRKLAPAALVILIIIATTVALVLYFGLR